MSYQPNMKRQSFGGQGGTPRGGKGRGGGGTGGPGKGGGNDGTPSKLKPGGPVCEFCIKKKQDANHHVADCTKRKGCGKCKTPADHKVGRCDATSYPITKNQVCDWFLQKGHEAKDCGGSLKKNKPRNEQAECSLCGHIGHEKKDCYALKISSAEKDVLERFWSTFTRRYRDAWLERWNPMEVDVKKLLEEPGKPPVEAAVEVTQGNTGGGNDGNTGRPKKERVPTEAEEERLRKQPIWDKAALDMPKQGPTGISTKMMAHTNFLEVKFRSNPSQKLYKYTIIFGKTHKGTDVVKRETKRVLVENLFRKFATRDTPVFATDYISTVVAVGRLYDHPDGGQGTEIAVQYDAIGARGAIVQMDSRLKYEGFVNLDALKRHVNGQDDRYIPNEELKALNILSWGKYDEGISGSRYNGGTFGNKFFPGDCTSRGLQQRDQHRPTYFARQGFFASMRPGINSVVLNVNVVTSAFFPPNITVANWIERRWGKEQRFRDWDQELKGVKVIFDGDRPEKRPTVDKEGNKIDYPRGSPVKIRSIWCISHQTVSAKRFRDHRDRQVTVHDYLNDKYRLCRPFDPNDWSVNLGNAEKENWYPADKLVIQPWQISRGRINDRYSDMVKAAEVTPQACKARIQLQGVRDLLIRPNDNRLRNYYQSFGLEIANELMQVPLLYRSTPVLKFGWGITPITPYLASWDLKQKGFVNGAAKSGPLCVIHFHGLGQSHRRGREAARGNYNDLNDAELFNMTKELRKDLVDYGVYQRPPNAPACPIQSAVARMIPHRDATEESMSQALDAAYKELAYRNADIGIILVILNDKSKDNYSWVKRWGDCKVGITTVCSVREKFENLPRDGTLRANICLKLNAKLQGTSHEVQMPKEFSDKLEDTIIMGADVTHPGGGTSKDCPSMAGLVASSDRYFSQYLGSARLQTTKMEYIVNLAEMVQERVMAHARSRDGKLPRRVLFYRDGVSESQYGMVRHEELRSIKEGFAAACQQNNQAPFEPQITLIVVGKRHHVRFYPLNGSNKRRKDHSKTAAMLWRDDPNESPFDDPNLKPGFVVDDKIVTPNHFSFYLQSHHSPLGTARSAHYVVIENGMNFSASELHDVTHHLTYNGSRCTKALSIATPARYADFLCDRLRHYMKPALTNNLGNAPNARDPKLPAQFANHPHLWGAHGTRATSNQNPWHPNMDNIMFFI